MPRFKKVTSNGWEYPVMKKYKMACCDCGLVHNIDFQVIRILKVLKKLKNGTQERVAETISDKAYQIRLRATRNERSTAQMRRHDKKKKA